MHRIVGHDSPSIRAARLRQMRSTRRRRKGLLGSLRLGGAHHPHLTDTDLLMMGRAIRLARQAAKEGEVPVGAVVYRGNEIIAEAANNREATQDPVGHAELLAMSLAGQKLGTWRLHECSLAVTLEPCPMCAGAMVNARLGRLIYGVTDPKAGACHTLFEIPADRRLNHTVKMYGGVMANECRRLLQDFFRGRREAKRASRETPGA